MVVSSMLRLGPGCAAVTSEQHRSSHFCLIGFGTQAAEADLQANPSIKF